MSRDPQDSLRISRRVLFARAAALGAGAVVSARTLAWQTRPAPLGPASGGQVVTARREPSETLTAAEAATLEAIVARLIPTDANGLGATEARAARYIDRGLGGALAASRETYRRGLSAVDAYARRSQGGPFALLSAAAQDAVLNDLEANVASGFTPDSLTFFDLVRVHTIQGTFCDPYYGGNAGFIGWDLIGYPGIRLAAAADDQRLDRRPEWMRRSAYDYVMFSKKRPA